MALQFICVIVLLAVSAATSVKGDPVEVYACDFTDCSKPLAGFDISVIETGDVWTTDTQGMLYLNYSVGQMLSFVIKAKDLYHETQSGTVIVPPGGLTGDQNQVVLQVPNDLIYELFKLSTNGHKSDSKCQVVVTVCNKNATVFSFPQGIPGAVVTMNPPSSDYTYYFGVWGRFSNETDPLPNDLTNTSWDGGVLLENVEPDVEQIYTVSAALEGYTFSESLIRCTTPGRFVNAAPNQGPRIQTGADIFPPHELVRRLHRQTLKRP